MSTEHWLVSYEYWWGKDIHGQKSTTDIRMHPAKWLEAKRKDKNIRNIVLLFAMRMPTDGESKCEDT